jgi:hypothetical protein
MGYGNTAGQHLNDALYRAGKGKLFKTSQALELFQIDKSVYMELDNNQTGNVLAMQPVSGPRVLKLVQA